MRLLCTSLFLSYIVAFTICVQGCRPTRIETFAFDRLREATLTVGVRTLENLPTYEHLKDGLPFLFYTL